MSPAGFRGVIPSSTYKREQAAISRGTLYPVTAFYSAAAIILLTLGVRSQHPYKAVLFFLAGIPFWTMVEYGSHRFVFHRHWKKSNRKYKKYFTYLSNKYLDPTHFGHHERPFDGTHINGRLKDILPVFLVTLPLTFLFPVYTAPVMLGGLVQSYVAEEWAHHCMHYYNFRNRYFRHIKKYHLYHHTSQGMHRGYGITSAFWDVILGSRFSPEVRQRLFGGKQYQATSSQTTRSPT
jgi:4-hydroxysphinganine ceramide fatty acyl 2-hydroxylase